MSNTDWLPQALCANHTDPDTWFTDSATARAHAIHMCRSHCPVLNQCQTDRGPRSHGVFAGVAYDQHGRINPDQQRSSSITCTTCTDLRAAAKAKPAHPDCGDYAAYRRHQRRSEMPCGPCLEAARRYDAAGRARRREAAA